MQIPYNAYVHSPYKYCTINAAGKETVALIPWRTALKGPEPNSEVEADGTNGEELDRDWN